MSEPECRDADGNADGENPEEELDIQFKPIVNLQPVDVKTLEEDEDEILVLRAKLFRFDTGGTACGDGSELRRRSCGGSGEHDTSSSSSCDTSLSAAAGEWKERGVGSVKLLKHRQSGHVRLVMRRDKTLKLCANHYVRPAMELKPSVGSDRSWVWSTLADFAEDMPRPELLAIRFANADNASKFKEKFDEARAQTETVGAAVSPKKPGPAGDSKDDADVAKIDTQVAALTVSG